jgi:hypothetical protein
VSTVFHKIMRPDMVAMGGSEPDTRPIIKPQTSPLALLLRNLQPLLAPDAFHPLVIHPPTLSSEQGGDTTLPITTIPFGKRNNVVSQSFLGICPLGYEPLGRPRLTHCSRCTRLRNSEFLTQVGHTSPAPLGAQ